MTIRSRVEVRRIYDAPMPDDGTRVLVDRLWPRGVSKARAQLDDWCKDIAPSTGLRDWYHHDPTLFGEFTRRYTDELRAPVPAAALARLKELATQRPLTLLTATKDPGISEAAVLRLLLTQDGPAS
ncbi:DUF488 domain-containing protein [Mycobacterium sp. 21AC1]|uniref:DUF488 domain-containing protein n=1 Tax=[Mycobacterium] appelbergii TaxID=2939269 RepID=UPI002938F60F|nr:DUF488 domain-containing protein [Mycobacterium sp. 21AC1]MDV3126770.1 DUF488 domain-containing protein [Mycobacterium sp. 21AC1]